MARNQPDPFAHMEIVPKHPWKHWQLYLHVHQYPYLGRCYAAARRDDAHEIGLLTQDELLEFHLDLLPRWEAALKKFSNPSKFNYSWLGNEWNHAHCHMIPRYKYEVSFAGREFVDPNPKGNYAPYEKKDIGDILREEIRIQIEQKIHDVLTS